MFILHALNTLTQNFFNNQGQVCLGLGVIGFIQVHKQCNKGCLTICSHKRVDLILNCLHSTLNFFLDTSFDNSITDFTIILIESTVSKIQFIINIGLNLLTANIDKRSQMGKGFTLTTILTACDLRHNLRCHITSSSKRMGLFDQSAVDYCTVLQHIFEIHQTAIVHTLYIIVGIMEMDNALVVCILNIFRQK